MGEPVLSIRLSQSIRFTGTASGVLPGIECEHCGNWVSSMGCDYPLVEPEKFRDVLREDSMDTEMKAVSLAEFEKIRERARQLYGAEVTLMPNAGVGEFDIYAEGRAPENLFEVECASPGGLLFSARLLNSLACYDIIVPHKRLTLRDCAGAKKFYGQLQLPVYRILDTRTFSGTSYKQCQHCGDVTCGPHSKVPETLYLNSAARETIAPIFRVLGFEGIKFVRYDVAVTLRELDNTGVELKPSGEWV